jgi:hypothetical protein
MGETIGSSRRRGTRKLRVVFLFAILALMLTDSSCKSTGITSPAKLYTFSQSSLLSMTSPTGMNLTCLRALGSSVSSSGKRYLMLRFDDSWQDQWVNMIPLLEKYRFSATFCVITAGLTNNGISNQISNSGIEYMSWQEVEWLYQNGYFIVEHPDAETPSLSDINHQTSA